MGKSAVDLPDPLEQNAPEPLTSAAPAGVDDLLAQMAGDEIDRLLAEADNPAPPPAKPAAPAPVAAPAPAKPVAKAPAAAPAPAPVVEAAPARPAPAEADVEDEGATSAAERSALEMPAEPDIQAAPEEPLFTEEEANAAMAGDERLPFYLKPLEWINAPLEALPEGVRDAVGKIGLLTLFNALAVLIYVLVFRRRH